MTMNAYINLEQETDESLGYIVEGIKEAVRKSGMDLRYDNTEPVPNVGSDTYSTQINVYGFPDKAKILEFSDAVGKQLNMEIFFNPVEIGGL